MEWLWFELQTHGMEVEETGMPQDNLFGDEEAGIIVVD